MTINPHDCAALGLRMRRNNFDLLRFLFAFVVFLVHAYVLSKAETLTVLTKFLSSEIAVKSFFVVSGFLIFMSYENSRNLVSYFEKRARRIYPAYFVVIVLCAFLGSLLSAYTPREYFSMQFVQYLAANLLFLNFIQPNLPGLFEGLTLPAVNGALWTLKIEVLFYLFVPLAVMALRRFGCLSVLAGIYLGSIAYSVLMENLAAKTGSAFYAELQRQLPGQLAFFISGAACYYYFEQLSKHSAWLVLLAVAAFILQAWLPWKLIQPAALAILVVYIACVIPCLGNFGKYGDFSYGVYIVHFPILQLMVSLGWFAESPWMMLVLAAALVLVAAFLLWHGVEKQFLRKSSHYVAATRDIQP